jgi:photosystem II stability/assembly factor-like uncharacterized protein
VRTTARGGAVHDLTFIDDRTGWAVGGTDDGVFFAATQDGGRRWTVTEISPEASPAYAKGQLAAVAFQDAKNGRAYGSHALAFATADGGKSWARVPAPGDARDYAYGHGLHCVVLGSVGFSRASGFHTFRDDPQRALKRAKSPDGRIFHAFQVQIAGPNLLWAFEATAVHRSRDGGDRWETIELPETQEMSTVVDRLVSAYFLSETMGWMALEKGRLLFTEDGGATRRDLRPTGLTLPSGPMHFFNPREGLMLARDVDAGKGSIFVTSDGGTTWKEGLTLGSGDWSSLFVLDPDHAWVAGRTDPHAVVRSFSPTSIRTGGQTHE